jgi:hypothetical protein
MCGDGGRIRLMTLLCGVGEVKKFILKRYMKYTEILEVEAETFGDAVKIVKSADEFERIHDDTMMDYSVEWAGDVYAT